VEVIVLFETWGKSVDKLASRLESWCDMCEGKGDAETSVVVWDFRCGL